MEDWKFPANSRQSSLRYTADRESMDEMVGVELSAFSVNVRGTC